MRRGREPAGEREILAELAVVLRERGEPAGRPLLARPPVRHARSTIYFVADADRGSRDPRWVVKRPDSAAAQEDLASPLTAKRQFDALEAVAAHFDAAPPELRAVRPVGFLAETEALAMEYVAGIPLDRLVRPRALTADGALLRGIGLSGAFLAHLHAIRPAGRDGVDLGRLAADLLRLGEETLAPAGLAVPPELTAALRSVPGGPVAAPIVPLHGDFVAVNMICGDGPSITGIDVSLDDNGPAEADMARFVMMLGTQRMFLAGQGVRRVAALRRRSTAALFAGYDGRPVPTALFELELVRQLLLRWLQRHRARLANHPHLGGLRRGPVDRYFTALLRERATELERALASPAARLTLDGGGFSGTAPSRRR